MRATDLEALREAFSDKRLHLAVALVKKVELVSDMSKWRAQCQIVPDEFEVVATGTWDSAGPDAGIYQFPVPDDLVLVGFVTPDECYILRRLSSKTDRIPLQAITGATVIKALSGKKAYLMSDSAVLLGSGGLLDPSEPLVLGNVLVSMLSAVMEKLDALVTKLITGPIGMGNLGSPVPTYPALVTDLTALKVELSAIKLQYLDTPLTDILSTVAFTEK